MSTPNAMAVLWISIGLEIAENMDKQLGECRGLPENTDLIVTAGVPSSQNRPGSVPVCRIDLYPAQNLLVVHPADKRSIALEAALEDALDIVGILTVADLFQLFGRQVW